MMGGSLVLMGFAAPGLMGSVVLTIGVLKLLLSALDQTVFTAGKIEEKNITIIAKAALHE